MSVRERLRAMDRWAVQPGAPGMKIVGAVTVAVLLVVVVVASRRVPVTIFIGPAVVAALLLLMQWRRGRI